MSPQKVGDEATAVWGVMVAVGRAIWPPPI